jgi:hydrogenase/urease accessory protein HupE
MKTAARPRVALVLALTMLPPAAQAHVGVQTVELLAGALHPWINLESGLPLAGLSLWLAQAATLDDTRPFVITGLCISLGAALGWFVRVPAPPWLITCATLGIGLCLTLRIKLRLLPWLTALALAASLAGYCAGVDAAPDIRTPLIFFLGVLAGGLVVPLTVAVALGGRGIRAIDIGIRILGSWLAAASLMLLALGMRR